MPVKKARTPWTGDRLVRCVEIVYDLMIEAPIRIAERVLHDAEKAGLSHVEVKKTIQHMLDNSLLYEFEAVLDMRKSINDTERSTSYVRCRYFSLSATRVVNAEKQLVPLVSAVNNGVPMNIVLPTLYRGRKRKTKGSGVNKKTAAALQSERDAKTSMHSSTSTQH